MQEKCLGFEDLKVVPDYRSFYEPYIDPKLKYYSKPHNFRFKRTEDGRWSVAVRVVIAIIIIIIGYILFVEES
jgi:hypothetical protein